MRPLAGLLVILTLCVDVRPATAGEPEVWAEAAINTPTVRLGEPFRLALTAGARQGWVFLPGRGLGIPGCRLLDYHEGDVSSRHEGYNTRQGRYRLAAFRVGTLTLPPIPIPYQDAAGTTGTVRSLPVRIRVLSENPAPGLALLDPRPPRRGPPAWPLWLLAATVVAALIGWTRPRRRKSAPPPPPAHWAALRELDALGTSAVMAQERGEEFFIRLSRILRRYLAERYAIPAREGSRQAILEALRQQALPTGLCDAINRVLEEADLVKFAQTDTDAAHLREALAAARRIVEETREPAARRGGPA